MPRASDATKVTEVTEVPRVSEVAELAVHDWGGPAGAPALLLLHGLNDSGECWADAARRWTPRYRVLSWDARGHGRSPRFTEDQLAAGPGAVMVADLVAVLESLSRNGSGRPVLVGHSMGGGTAAAVAGDRPDLVRAAALEDPAVGETPESAAGRRESAAQWVSDARRWREDPAAARAAGMADNPGWPEAEYAAWARAKTESDLAMLATGRIRPPRPWAEVLAALAVPTLVVTGDDDLLWGDAERAAARALRNPLLRVAHVPGATHCVRRSRTAAFHALVDPWLREVTAG